MAEQQDISHIQIMGEVQKLGVAIGRIEGRLESTSHSPGECKDLRELGEQVIAIKTNMDTNMGGLRVIRWMLGAMMTVLVALMGFALTKWWK